MAENRAPVAVPPPQRETPGVWGDADDIPGNRGWQQFWQDAYSRHKQGIAGLVAVLLACA
jgi:hypothetical protein